MVASGLPTPRDDHAVALASMALEMNEYSRTGRFSFRLGINSGPAVAGVIGTKKFQYDVWGDTVNIASRMESHSEPGKIQVSEATQRLIKDHFETTPRGRIAIKGKGTLNIYWLMSTAGVTCASRCALCLLLTLELEKELHRTSRTLAVEVGRTQVERGRNLELVALEQR